MSPSSDDSVDQSEDSRVSRDHTGDNFDVSTYYEYAEDSKASGITISDCLGSVRSLLDPCLGKRKKQAKPRPNEDDYENLEDGGRDDDTLELSGLESSNTSQFPMFDAALAKAGLDPSYADPEERYADGEPVVRAYQGGLEATSSAKRNSNGPKPDQTTPQAENPVSQPRSIDEQD